MNYHIAFTGYSLHALARPRLRGLFVSDIQQIVADYYVIPLTAMTSANRAREWAWPRQVAMFLCREITGRSLPDIGRRFGNRDHTTVMHAVRAIQSRRLEDPELAHDLRTLTAQLQALR